MRRIGGADAHAVTLAQKQPADVERDQVLGLLQDFSKERIEINIGPERVADQILGRPDDGAGFVVNGIVHDTSSR